MTCEKKRGKTDNGDQKISFFLMTASTVRASVSQRPPVRSRCSVPPRCRTVPPAILPAAGTRLAFNRSNPPAKDQWEGAQHPARARQLRPEAGQELENATVASVSSASCR